MATVTFDNASRQFPGAPKPAVDSLNLHVGDGEFLVLVGPSGCGKSTSLRMIAGLEPVTNGRVLIDDVDMRGVRPRDRDVAVVFQSYALYPNMSVAENLAFALKNAKAPRELIRERVAFAARALRLGELLDRKPGQLSGGQRQRVAMGRAIVREPRIFCMDEPLSNLDAKLRVSTRAEIAALQRRLGVTTVYVTHDQVEAMTMADRVAVLADGRLQQVAAPIELYRRPDNAFVASFIGSPAITLLDLALDEDGVRIGDARVGVPRDLRPADARGITVGVRPEGWRLVEDAEPGLELRVDLVEQLGAESYLYGTVSQRDAERTAFNALCESRRVAVHLERHQSAQVGTTVRVRPDAQELLFFDAQTGAALR